jgi:tetratricopeptide (TPR) repeat protein
MFLKRLRFAALLVAAGAATHLFHSASLERDPAETNEVHLYLPSGSFLRQCSLGQRTTLSDLYWLKLVQYLGTSEASAAGFPQLLALAHVVTDLDLRYGYPYMVAGLVLGVKHRVDESNEILEKGFRNAPDRWEIPFYLAFNYWYERGDLVTGAAWLERSARIPGRPELVPGLARTLYSDAGQVDTAIRFTAELLRQAPTEEERAALEQRLQDLRVEKDLRALEDALATFETREGRPAYSLDELVGTVMPALPVGPGGVPYVFNVASHHPESFLLLSRTERHHLIKQQMNVRIQAIAPSK